MKEIFTKWAEYMEELCPGEWRIGQALFAAVAEVRPDLTDLLQRTAPECDPFHDDSKIGAMLSWLYEQGVQ